MTRTSSYLLRQRVFKRDQGICAVCGVDTYEAPYPKDSWQTDHIVAKCEGGSDDMSNLRTLCFVCNLEANRALRQRRPRTEEFKRQCRERTLAYWKARRMQEEES